MIQTKFQTNLEEAQRAEHAAIMMFKRAGKQAWINSLNREWCDIWVKGEHGHIPIEVKTDFESVATGNVAIEPQTLGHTRAQYFLYFLPKGFLVPTATLKTLYTQYRDTGKDGGDQNRRLALIPKETFYLNSNEII